jgi:hypothetical protein
MSTYNVKLKVPMYSSAEGKCCHVDEKYKNRTIDGKVVIDSNPSGSSILRIIRKCRII